jgi:hypothetical protein
MYVRSGCGAALADTVAVPEEPPESTSDCPLATSGKATKSAITNSKSTIRRIVIFGILLVSGQNST